MSLLLGLFIFPQVGDCGVILASADPLDTWTLRNPLPTANDLNGIAYGNGQFVAVGEPGTILTSTNGFDWSLQWSGTELPLLAVAYGKGRFVTVGERTRLGEPNPNPAQFS